MCAGPNASKELRARAKNSATATQGSLRRLLAEVENAPAHDSTLAKRYRPETHAIDGQVAAETELVDHRSSFLRVGGLGAAANGETFTVLVSIAFGRGAPIELIVDAARPFRYLLKLVDASQHASAHARGSGHSVIRSFEPGEE